MGCLSAGHWKVKPSKVKEMIISVVSLPLASM